MFNFIGSSHYCDIQYPAQRWIAFQDIGPSPSGRSGHAVASDGRRVFVLGGELSPGAQGDETKLIHVLDTSMYFLFVISFGQPPSLKIQCTSITRNLTPTLPILCGRCQQVPRVRDNRISHHLRRTPMQHVVLLLLQKLPQINVSRRKTMVAEHQRSIRQRSWPRMLLLGKKLHGRKMSVSLSLSDNYRKRLLRKLSGTSVLHS